MPSIALVECWFGPFPVWHDFYLKSCEQNPDINFIIVYDGGDPSRRPKNVRWIKLSKPALEARAKKILGTEIRLANGFKVTDLRPAFGAIFRDELKDFEFWGYNDSDMFWGQILQFLPRTVLDNYDVITGCRTSVVGQFTLFRNSGITQDVYQLLPEFSATINRPEPAHLDEDILDSVCAQAKLKIYRRQLQVHDAGSMEWEKRARTLHTNEGCDPAEWFWEEGECVWLDGKLTHAKTGRDVMFVHFKSWKRDWNKMFLVPRLIYWDNQLRGFRISERGIDIIPRKSAALVRFCYRLRFYTPLKVRKAKTRVADASRRIYNGLRRRL